MTAVWAWRRVTGRRVPAKCDRHRAWYRGAAVHEFAHQLLAIDRTGDRQTYEYGSADRREQYNGEMRWGDAWPALHKRLGAGAPQ